MNFQAFAAFAVAMVCATTGAVADGPAEWRVWLEPAAATESFAVPGFPAEHELSILRENRAWLASWAEQTPSVAWNDVVSRLVVKYQQNP